VRGMFERLLGHITDGPDPPPRLRETVIMFRVVHPCATPDEWEGFAVSQAEDAYRSGFIRGLEWSAHELDRMDPDDVERLADLARNDWSLYDTIPTARSMLDKRRDPNDPLAHLPPEERVELLKNLAAHVGGFEVVLDPLEPDGDDF